jgi:hypothetical protein
VCLFLQGRWQELASARGMHGHVGKDGPSPRLAHPVSGQDARGNSPTPDAAVLTSPRCSVAVRLILSC